MRLQRCPKLPGTSRVSERFISDDQRTRTCHTQKKDSGLFPGRGPQALSPRCRLGPRGRAATHPRENETTAAIAEGQNAARGSPDIDNHKYEASPRTPAPLTPQAGVSAAAAPPGAHGTTGDGGEERGGGATPAPTAPSRPGGTDPAAAPRRNAGRAPPSLPAGAQRRAALTLCAGADLGHRFLHRRHRRGGGAAASLQRRALHLPPAGARPAPLRGPG